MKRVVILGSTGSIGTSALRVVDRHPEQFHLVALAANESIGALSEQVGRYRPEVAVLAAGEAAAGGRELPAADWRWGYDAVLELAGSDDVDVVVNALVGSAGLALTLRALESGKRLALANKESLVAGGPLVMQAAARGGGELVPIDSEHSAILQCLEGSGSDAVARIVLTASGGPFRDWSDERLQTVRPSEALRHPTWNMGAKITIDSATLANKALEVIEAHFLYGLDYDQIDVVVHPQSIVHSLVEFRDGSVLAQLGFPTMELPILYALSYPERVQDDSLRTFDPVASSPLTFEEVDGERFRLFELGVQAGRTGGTAPAVYNAANEVAVEAFLEERVRFPEMADVVEMALERLGSHPIESLKQVTEVDRSAREVTREAVGCLGPLRSRSK